MITFFVDGFRHGMSAFLKENHIAAAHNLGTEIKAI